MGACLHHLYTCSHHCWELGDPAPGPTLPPCQLSGSPAQPRQHLCCFISELCLLESVYIFQTRLDKSSFSSELGIFNEKFSTILEHYTGHVKYTWRQGWASCRTAVPSCCSQIVCSGMVETQPGEGLSGEDWGKGLSGLGPWWGMDKEFQSR